MDYEKNNEALAIVKRMVIDGQISQEVAEKYFPELKESEDEKIRKALIDFFNRGAENGEQTNGVHDKDILAWLEKQGEEIIPLKEIILNVWELGNYWKELTKGICNTEHGTQLDYIVKHWKEGEHYIKSFNKQGEQKPINIVTILNDYFANTPKEQQNKDWEELKHLNNFGWELIEQKSADKVEPKFHEGDWVVIQESAYQITKVENLNVTLSLNGREGLFDTDVLKNARLWDITKDAKDGDVLLFEGNYNSIVLFQGIGINGEGRINYHCKCDLGDYSFCVQGDVACLGTIEKDAKHYHPATKEQRDLLFAKMHEAGYKWDAEKK